MNTILVDGKPVEVSRFSRAQVDALWDGLEAKMGSQMQGAWGNVQQSDYLMYAVKVKLISLEDAKELYFVAKGFKITED